MLRICKTCCFSRAIPLNGLGSMRCHFYPAPTDVQEGHWCGQWKSGDQPQPAPAPLETRPILSEPVKVSSIGVPPGLAALTTRAGYQPTTGDGPPANTPDQGSSGTKPAGKGRRK